MTISSEHAPEMKKRKRPHVARLRENTSAIVMMPYEVAEQLLISEREVYTLMALGVEKGGLRAICLGDPKSARPRKVIHYGDFALFVRYKRGLLTLPEYLKELAKPPSAEPAKDGRAPYARMKGMLAGLAAELENASPLRPDDATESQKRELLRLADRVSATLRRALSEAIPWDALPLGGAAAGEK